MGCNCTKNSATMVERNCHIKSEIEPLAVMEIKRNYFHAVNKGCWFIILNFLHYRDLKEVGKTNK